MNIDRDLKKNLKKIRIIYKMLLFEILEERKDVLYFLKLYDEEKKIWGGFNYCSYLRYCEQCRTYGTAQESILKYPVIQFKKPSNKFLCKKCRRQLKLEEDN